MWQKLSVVAAIVALLASQVVHSRLTDGRDRPGALEEAVAKLDRVPLTIGPWHGQTQSIDPDEVVQARLAGHTLRRYQNTLTGESVTILLVCGRPGPISVHTPDVCYGSAGYDVADQPARRSIALPSLAYPAEFWMAQFHKPDAALPGRLRIYWAWNAGGTWEAADNARLAFAGFPVLYKLYVVSEEIPSESAPTRDSGKEFLEQLLPELQKVLSAAGK